MTIIEKEIVINLDGKEGSAWVLLEYAREYAKDFLGLVSENDIESICDEMKDGDYIMDSRDSVKCYMEI